MAANPLPAQTPNTSAPIIEIDVGGSGSSNSIALTPSENVLTDSVGGPVTGTLVGRVTKAWRYLFGTFVQRSASVDPTFSLTASATYSQSQLQQLIAQVELLSQAVGQQASQGNT